MNEIRVKGEYWEIWENDKKATLNTPIIWNIITNSSGVFIFREQTTSKPNGILNITYIFLVGSGLKYIIKWVSMEKNIISGVQVKQIHLMDFDRVTTESGISMIQKNEKSNFYLFGYGVDNYWLLENQHDSIYNYDGTIKTEKCLISGNIDFSGKKVTYIFGDWSLSLNQFLVIDPTTTTWNVGLGTDDILVLEVGTVHPPWDTRSLDIGWNRLGFWVTSYRGMGARFTNIVIPNGNTIISAYFSIMAYDNQAGTTVNLRLACEDIDDATTFSTVANYNARNRTSYINWSNLSAWTANIWYNSTDISSIIQTVINRVGWSSGNDIVIFCEDDGTSTSFRTNTYYESDTTKAPKLVITYLSIYTYTVNQMIHVGYTSSILKEMIKTMSKQFNIVLDSSELRELSESVYQAFSLGYTTSNLREMIKTASQQFNTIFDSSILRELSKLLSQAINVGYTTSSLREIIKTVSQQFNTIFDSDILRELSESMSQAININYDSDKLMELIMIATQNIATTFNASIPAIYTIIVSIQITIREWGYKGVLEIIKPIFIEEAKGNLFYPIIILLSLAGLFVIYIKVKGD